MSLIDHPNVVKAFCSFVVERNLWVVMPFMAEGSCLHLMKIAYPEGFEEAAIGSILKETLKALDYLHRQGHIHRDVKVISSLFFFLLHLNHLFDDHHLVYLIFNLAAGWKHTTRYKWDCKAC